MNRNQQIRESNRSVAVVIAYFNGKDFIERALASIKSQTTPASEVIVVDDGSDPEHSNFLLGLKSQFTFAYLRSTNKGQSAARNLGVNSASANFICFLDQDDYFLPGHIEDLLSGWDKNDPNFAFTYGDLWRQSENGTVLSHSCVNIETHHPHLDLAVMIKSNLYILPSATLISRQIFTLVGGFDEQFRGYEDDDLFIRLFSEGYSSRFIGKPVSVWTVNMNSTSFSESMSRSRYLYFKKLLSNFGHNVIPNTKVFGDLLVARFAFQFAADVISAAMTESVHFIERQNRLAEFREIFAASDEVARTSKKKYLLATYPLVLFGPRVQRVLLKLAIKMPHLIDRAIYSGASDFISRHAINV
jgi:glycosyltransferase involved in cell wall biosynthesis